MSLSVLSNWGIGILNGYSHKEGGIPTSIKYTAMSVTSFLHAMRILGASTSIKPNPSPGLLLSSILIGTPLIMGASFCVGTHFGKAIEHVQTHKLKNVLPPFSS